MARRRSAVVLLVSSIALPLAAGCSGEPEPTPPPPTPSATEVSSVPSPDQRLTRWAARFCGTALYLAMDLQDVPRPQAAATPERARAVLDAYLGRAVAGVEQADDQVTDLVASPPHATAADAAARLHEQLGRARDSLQTARAEIDRADTIDPTAFGRTVEDVLSRLGQELDRFRGTVQDLLREGNEFGDAVRRAPNCRLLLRLGAFDTGPR
ncbi:MAG TPA: hypothetical protein VIL00_08010 [Pseudonocardiaceae bacterium]